MFGWATVWRLAIVHRSMVLVGIAEDAESVGMCPERLAQVQALCRGYVDRGEKAFTQVLVARAGKIVLEDSYGLADLEAQTPVADDAIVRIYSMTKPLTCVAALMCYEKNCFQLDDPVSKYLPEFASMQVFVGGTADAPGLQQAASPITIAHLFTHTSGIGAGTDPALAKLQQRQARAWMGPPSSLAEEVKRIAEMPLMAHPGTRWHYASGHTVLGRCIEVWTGVEYSEFLRTRIFEPLRMDDTSFVVEESKRDRFTKNYRHGSIPLQAYAPERSYFDPNVVPGPSGGLTGTIRDYWKFCQCLLNNLKGQTFEGVRLLGRKTAEFIGTNHLPNHCDMATMGQASFSESPMDGVGFGLGVAVVVDPARSQLLRSPGEWYWGGMASTAFWVDPQEDMVTVFFTQLVPSGSTPIRPELRIAVNAAVIDAPRGVYMPSTGSVTHRL